MTTANRIIDALIGGMRDKIKRANAKIEYKL